MLSLVAVWIDAGAGHLIALLQPPVPAHRPRIGLALSGGGALGLAEIGVIQWMEENHIPVDRIAGTSMGSIIGAMYATGMSPAEIQKFAEKIDWDEAFLARAGLHAAFLSRRKQDRRDFLINAPLGLKHGLNGPNGFNSGQGVGLLLDRIAFPESGVASFDDLPIPFRCVATDMLSGEGVVLRDGPLAQAVRASMAIPGVFTPVEINGRVLADGGMVQNIPVETVLGMDADAVIAVELRLPPGNPQRTGNSHRSADSRRRRDDHAERAAFAGAGPGQGQHQHGRVRMRPITRASRNSSTSAIRAAASQSAALLPYAIQDPAEWQEYLAARAARKHRPPDKVEIVEVAGADPDTDQRLQNRLTKALRGRWISPRSIPN